MIEVKEEKYRLPSGASLTMQFSTDAEEREPHLTLTTTEGLKLTIAFDGKGGNVSDSCRIAVQEEGGASTEIRMRHGRRL